MEKPKTYKDYAMNHVYSGIMAGQYSSGEKILEKKLSLDLGISRAPVREALRELVGEGLLEYRPQVGHFVTEMEPTEIVHAYSTRGVLEGYAAAQASGRLKKADFRVLNGLVKEMGQAAQAGQQRAVVESGEEFHHLILERCPNRHLYRYSTDLSRRLHVLFYRYWPALYSPAEVAARHEAIIIALVSGDARRIEEAVRGHYFETGQKIAARYQGQENGTNEAQRHP